jgi:hypothetical protein
MARKIRIEYAGAAYPVMARGNQGRDIYADERDRKLWLATLGEACEKTGWRIPAWVIRDESRVAQAMGRLKRKGRPELKRLKRRLEQVYENHNAEVEARICAIRDPADPFASKLEGQPGGPPEGAVLVQGKGGNDHRKTASDARSAACATWGTHPSKRRKCPQ